MTWFIPNFKICSTLRVKYSFFPIMSFQQYVFQRHPIIICSISVKDAKKGAKNKLKEVESEEKLLQEKTEASEIWKQYKLILFSMIIVSDEKKF